MNLFADIRAVVLDAIAALTREGVLPEGLNTDAVTTEPPRDPLHGDMATNAAMVLAKPAGKKPRDIAEALAAKLVADSRVASAEVAGPGFLNLRLEVSVWQSVPGAILKAGTAYGRSDMGTGSKVNVEYVSANPTGPMHVGHARGAIVGDAMASLLAYAGYDVTREYYINDGGAQVDVLARSVFNRYLEAHDLTVDWPEGSYPGDYLVPVGEALKAKVGDIWLEAEEDVWLEPVREFAIAAMMDLIRDDLAALNVHMDVFFSEKSLYGTGKIEAAIDSLKAMGLVYRGILPKPKGKADEDWEEREQWLFKSTEFGDDEDRPVMKADGSWAYFAPDIAYHYDKVQRGFDLLINIFGADHGGYVKRLKAVVKALSNDRVPLDIKLIQLVKLFKNGAPFKMSKRAGTFITLRDLVDEVGADVARFHMLTRKSDAALDFDFDKVVEQSKENPVFYVQYAHARISSAMRKAREAGFDISDAALAGVDLSGVVHASELSLVGKLAEWPRLVEIAARTHEPHRIATYLSELAAMLHGLWNAGKEHPELRFLQDTEAATQPKIALAHATAVVISAGLGILGVTPVEEMR
ncbi:arginine--tRNA ligase [Sagittula salina]|uniref:Arginine--tRNA ligase n=1 Tax=Sagittula salina TaxID=2820268 RepID=A0A940S3N5_9RHOB|nr:arginine--tRNA ligase [Sagittula salina]MBP0482975.1 arginine--tRNA ligase [Sagittula salina]